MFLMLLLLLTTMDVQPLLPCLLLLAVCVCGHSAAPRTVRGGRSPEDEASRLRGQWRLSLRDSKLKGSGVPPHPIRGPVAQQLLYCRIGIGYHLQILSNGTVGGVHEPTEHSLLKVFAMKRGVVGIRGVGSGLYLCMNQDGVVHGEVQFSSHCLWKESLEENHYTTYSSLSHPGLYLALSHRGEAKRGTSVGRHQPCTHFLPRRAP